VRTIMRERLLFQSHEARRGNLGGNRAPNRGIFCSTSTILSTKIKLTLDDREFK